MGKQGNMTVKNSAICGRLCAEYVQNGGIFLYII